MGIKQLKFTPALPVIILKILMLQVIFSAAGCTTYSVPDKYTPVLPVRQVSLQAVHDGFTWQHLVNHVVAASPDYAAILAEARADFFNYRSKTNPENLRFSFEASYLPVEKRINQYSAGISFSVPNPFVSRQVIRTGEAAMRETEAGAQALRNEIASMIYELVQEILIGERELSILSLREQVLSDWTAFLQMRYDARLATQTDMLQFDIQSLRLKTAIRQTRQGIQEARRILLVLVQIPDEQLVLNPHPADWKALLTALDDEEELINYTLSRSAELAGAKAAYEKARAVLGAARARQIPWFDSVFFSYDPGFTETASVMGGVTRIKTNKWTAGVSVNLPVFAWFSSEKKMGAFETAAASQRVTGVSQRIRNDITGIIEDLRNALNLLIDYQIAFDSISKPARETIPDTESYYKLLDAWLSASEYALELELQCVQIYSKFLKIAGVWD